ncbi:hypothetical protein DB354_18590 [Opitutus sp. ER46]|nr:hypothetical protein DB354_18590 [Opitutus sp. ER46]
MNGPRAQSAATPAAMLRQLLPLLASLLLAGCATPGPAHLYTVAPRAPEIRDRALDGRDVARDVPSFLEPGDTVTGFAYDPFTDHFFLRLAPGNQIRVVDRPARAIKRAFTIDPSPGPGGDLALNPRDGHLFLLDATRAELVETSRLGAIIGRIPLQGVATPPLGVAFDARQDSLLVLLEDGLTLHRFSLTGLNTGKFQLARHVRAAIAFDSDARELYAPLADADAEIGVFDEQGQLMRTLPAPDTPTFLDVGPHAFLRVF